MQDTEREKERSGVQRGVRKKKREALCEFKQWELQKCI
jgi:hypothetical protein